MLKLIITTSVVFTMSNLVESKSLMDTVTHELYLQQTADNRVSLPHVDINYHDIEHETSYAFIVWSVAKYKSFMRGVSLGIYDDPSVIVNDECLNLDAVEAMYNLVEGFHHGSGLFDTFLKVFTAFYVTMMNLQVNCKTYQFLYDTATYCFRSDQCDSFDIYIYNLGVNMFPITLYFLQIVESLVVYRSPKNVHDVELKYE